MLARQRALEQALSERIGQLTQWLAANAPDSAREKAHLKNGPEQAYWCYGYLVALRDVLGVVEGHRRSLNQRSIQGLTVPSDL